MAKILQVLVVALLVITLGPKVWQEFQDRRHDEGWPTASGVLDDGYIREVVNNGTWPDGSPRETHHFELVVSYSYQVAGREYHGKRLRAAGHSYGTERGAKEALASLQSQDPLKVYYDPDNPASSVLIPG